MPSIPTHFLVGAALGQAAGARLRSDWRFWAAALVCSALPDVDVIGFAFGIRYGDLWGHRGMTHSLLFAAVIGFAVALFVSERGKTIITGFWLFLITASHGVLDAFTSRGLCVAFFSLFHRHRYLLL